MVTTTATAARSRDEDPPTEERASRVVLGGVLAFAVVVHSQLFTVVHDARGDLAYHRGVALTMTAGSWQGESPVAGVMSYFGGLFPMVLGWTAQLTGSDFDVLVSVVSWFSTLALPLTLLALGRRLWPGTTLEPALLVLVGTVGSSLAFSREAAWVYSVLPSGANQWPLYPRDVAVVLLYAGLVVALGPPSWRRAAAVGVVGALGVCTHAQVGAYATAAALVLLVVTARSAGVAWSRTLLLALVSGTTVVVLSAWWWAPRTLLVHEAGLRLRSHPLLPPLDASPWGVLDAFGLVGVLGVLGLATTLRGTPAVRTFGVWLLVLLPGVLAEPLLRDLGVITGRRVWLFAGVPLVVCAAAGAARVVRRFSLVPALGVLALALAVPSVAEVVQTRSVVETSWRLPTDDLGDGGWESTWASLRRETRAEGGLTVLAPDNDAASLWSQTGAQPFSLLLSGRNKIGFDVGRLTPWGYVERVRLQQRAFAAGRSGLCDLAARVDAQRLVLRRSEGLLGLHDLRPSAAHRVDPADRDRASIDRPVGPGTRYLDLNTDEVLSLAEGASIPVGFASGATSLLEIGFTGTPVDAPLVLDLPTGGVVVGRRTVFHVESFHLPGGVPAGARLRALEPVLVSRVTGYQPSPGPAITPGRGAVDLSTKALCGA